MKSFLSSIRFGPRESTQSVSYSRGYLRIQYDEDGAVCEIGWTPTENGNVTGLMLFFDWTNERVTCKTRNGLSGQCWSGGQVSFGTVFEDDRPPEPSRAIALEDWIDECLQEMAKKKA